MESKPDKLKINDDVFKSGNGTTLHYRSWTPAVKPEMVIALVHGLGEHSGRYEHWAQRFNRQSIAFTAFDLRGHGLSGGRRGNINSIEAVLEDISLFLEKVSVLFPGIPLVLYGHSLGGNLALNYGIRNKSKINGLIITSPWLELSSPLPKPVEFIVTVIGSVFPGFNRQSGLDVNGLCHDEAVITGYKSDPLVHDRISAGLFLSASRGGKEAIKRAGEITIPLLLMHGTLDRITSFKGSKDFAGNAGDNTTLRLWEDGYHELHNEPRKDEVFRHIIDWIDKNIYRNSFIDGL